MSGSLEAPDRCGKRYLLGCDEGHYFKMAKESECQSPTCSECRNSWRLRRGAAIALRIQAYIEQHGGLKDEHGGGLYVHHCIISPPQHVGIGSTRDVARLRKQAWDLAERKGCLGGVAVFHPWRGCKQRGWWRGPHFHFITISTRKWLDRGGRPEDNGWVFKVKRVSNLRQRYLQGHHRERAITEGVLRLARYELDHAGVCVKGNGRALHSITWYGAVSYRNFKLDDGDRELDERLKGKGAVCCPYCGSTDVAAVIDNDEFYYALNWIRQKELEDEGVFDREPPPSVSSTDPPTIEVQD